MGKRINDPGGDPDEYWFECDDCEGTGEVSIPDEDQEPEIDADGNEQYRYWHSATCPNCDGSGRIEGDETDL